MAKATQSIDFNIRYFQYAARLTGVFIAPSG
jgi:hypothetical protein